ncbi:LOW QUALITY PROTEIN: cilium assembly protein DZIP1L [Platichthys flesus]|uniref:LOW QUALITY PROTEIN: cilium assembly protein DZIP1L n=1 Tax=Platichthys flesus TaxID=8260 RepID=UPI002DBD5FDA|nr:LOW QUALITY PROTEIN: cilium assembly protein DZIP1L [Platichthys flesus]
MSCQSMPLIIVYVIRGSFDEKYDMLSSLSLLQPFHNGIFYPYTIDTQGTHSSAWIQSHLNCPLSHYPVPTAGTIPSSGTSTVPPFKFRRRGETVDWRQINRVDINLVKSQLDIDTLQDHIMEVTFCNLDEERCQECRNPVDPGLLKLLQLTQLSVEWLLHCQEVFSLSQRAAEERLEAARKEQKQLLEQQSQQEEKVKALKEELVLKGKVVSDLQSKLLLCSHKCQICKKGFFTPQFLKSHMERRHPEDHESQLLSDSEKKAKIDILKMEISGLRELNVQLQQNLDLKTAQEKRLESERDHYKAEEMARLDRVLADSADSKEQILLNQLKKQDEMWESMLQQKNEHHESSKNKLLDELSRVQSSVSAEQERSQQLKQEMEQLKQEMERRLQEMQLTIEAQREQEMERRLQEMQQTIEAQREQIINICSKAPTKEVEEPVVVSPPAPEPKPTRVVLEEPVFALNLEPIQELSQEETDLSSASEPEQSPSMTANALKMNPSNEMEIRRELEGSVSKRLEDLGVKPNQSGVKKRDFTSIMAKVTSEPNLVAKGMPGYWYRREEIARRLDDRLSETMATEAPPGGQSNTPQPEPRAESTTQPKTTPNGQAAPRTCNLMETGKRMMKWIRETLRKIRKSLSWPKRWSRSFKKEQERDQQEASS